MWRMNKEPWGHDQLNSVFQYLEPNLRFRLKIICPKLAPADNHAPLTLNRVIIERSQFIINETIYTVENISQEPEDDDDDVITHLTLLIKSARFTYVERLVSELFRIPHVMEFLFDKIFGKRDKPVLVKWLGLETITIPLPKDASFIVKDLQIPHNNFLKVFAAIENHIHPESIPLETVYIHGEQCEHRKPHAYFHPWIATAKYLQITERTLKSNWLPVLLNMPNQQVHLSCDTFSGKDIIKLVIQWLKKDPDVGCWYSIEQVMESEINQMISVFGMSPGAEIDKVKFFGCHKFPYLVLMPMKNKMKKLCVYVTNHLNKNGRFTNWDVNITVFAVDQ